MHGLQVQALESLTATMKARLGITDEVRSLKTTYLGSTSLRDTTCVNCGHSDASGKMCKNDAADIEDDASVQYCAFSSGELPGHDLSMQESRLAEDESCCIFEHQNASAMPQVYIEKGEMWNKFAPHLGALEKGRYTQGSVLSKSRSIDLEACIQRPRTSSQGHCSTGSKPQYREPTPRVAPSTSESANRPVNGSVIP